LIATFSFTVRLLIKSNIGGSSSNIFTLNIIDSSLMPAIPTTLNSKSPSTPELGLQLSCPVNLSKTSPAKVSHKINFSTF